MHTRVTRLILLFLFALVLTACGGGGDSAIQFPTPTPSPTPSGSNTGDGSTQQSGNHPSGSGTPSAGTSKLTSFDKQVTLSDTAPYEIKTLGSFHGNTHLDLNVSFGTTPKRAYLLATSLSGASVTMGGIQPLHKKTSRIRSFVGNPNNSCKMIRMEPYLKLLQRSSQKRVANGSIRTSKRLNRLVPVGTPKVFFLSERHTDINITATLRKRVSASTRFGNKTLEVWVADNVYGATCTKAYCLKQSDIDALTNTFLTSGSDNDIYDWVTSVFGEEWGAQAAANYSNLIPKNDTIAILLMDIDEDNRKSGGVIGYFDPKDNYLRSPDLPGSNEQLMLYVDAVMFASGAKEIYSTLAHEFQHMIHFYQKIILRLTGSQITDTWINEMLSEATEDLVAVKLKHKGPRNVDPFDGTAGSPNNYGGRYPTFNQNNARSLTAWFGDVPAYSKVSAFGTFLLRNYGGAKLLHDIVYNNKMHQDAVMEAVHQTANGARKNFGDLLREWGEAILLSDRTDIAPSLPIRYNRGDFFYDSYNGIVYPLGSINFFNYAPQPSMVLSGTAHVNADGIRFFKIGNSNVGKKQIAIDINGSAELTLIVERP